MNEALEEERPRGLSSRARTVLLVGAVLLGQLLLSWRWSEANGWFARPTITEATPYRITSAQLLVALEDHGFGAWLSRAITEPDDHTPLLPLAGSLVAFVTGDEISPRVMWLTMMLFAWLLGIGTFRLARNFLTPGAAAAVAALTLAAPVAQGYQRDYLTTLPMVAMLVWSLDSLLRSEFLLRRRPSALFGLFLGLAGFCKVIAPLYVVGPGLVALVVGIRRHRREALMNLALAVAFCLAVIGPWMLFSLGHVLRYTGDVVDQKGIEAESVFTLRRWSYYPLQVLNRGFGFALGLLVVLAAIDTLLRGRLRGLDPRVWMLSALVLVSWVVLTYGQTTTGAQYVFLWVPLGATLLLAWITNQERPFLRRTLGVLTALALALNVGLAQRPITDDRVLVKWKGLDIVGSTGQYLGLRQRRMRVRPRPEAEPWPVREFTELVLADAEPAIPRLAGTHPIVSANMTYEAILLRRELDRVSYPWPSILARAHRKKEGRERFVRPAGGADPSWPLTTIDYFVADSLLLDVPLVVEMLERSGMDVEVLARREVTQHSTVELLALRKPWRRPARVPAGILEEPGVASVDVEFANGWRVHGFEVGPRPGSDGAPVLHVFAEPRPDGNTLRLVLVVESAAGEELWTGWRSLHGAIPAQSQWSAVSFDVLPLRADPGLRYSLSLQQHGKVATPLDVERANVPVLGRRVELTDRAQ